MRYEFIVSAEDAGKKAHEVLVQRHRFSRVQVKRIRLYGELLVNGKAQRMIEPLHQGERVFVSVEDEEELPYGSEVSATADIPIFYQDEWFIVVGKPAGLLTHPSYTGEKESLITCLSPYRLHPVTRLDRGTSGLIILAKSAQAHYSLSQIQVNKVYAGFVMGDPFKDSAQIAAPIGRKDGSIIEREVRDDGKESCTAYQVIERFGKTENVAAFLHFRLLTGRTHQIRVHCRFAGFPMLGDSLYPPDAQTDARLRERLGLRDYQQLLSLHKSLGRQALHAAELDFTHPYSQAALHFAMPLPEDLKDLRKALLEFT